MYCEKCCRIINADRCPWCRKSTVRMPEAKDPCFLTEQEFLPSSILEDLLNQSGIPFLKKGAMGAGLSARVGPMLDRSRFYVSYDQLQDALAVTDELIFEHEESAGQAPEENP